MDKIEKHYPPKHSIWVALGTRPLHGELCEHEGQKFWVVHFCRPNQFPYKFRCQLASSRAEYLEERDDGDDNKREPIEPPPFDGAKILKDA